jgi:hypothetical protein
MGDCVRSRDESIDAPLDPPLFWLDNIFNDIFVLVVETMDQKEEKLFL